MPVFDFSGASASKAEAKCTYTTFHSSHTKPSPEQPIMVLDNKERQWKHHSCGVFTNPVNRTAFDFKEEDGNHTADVLKIDSRFTSLLKWLGDSRINVRLSGTNREDGYAVYRIRETAFGGGTKLSAEDGFLQFMIERLLESNAPAEAEEDEEQEENGDEMKLTSIQSITDFMTCAGKTLPDNIRLWTRRKLAVARSSEVSQEERHHAQRALSIMLNIQWKNNYFEAIDPVEARRILDEELYGMERVKQRIIETIIQINRTHTLPAYGLLLIGPAGTGKSQIAYAVARILKLPWTTLDMSSINDSKQLTGSPRIYANAKPGIIMEAFSMAGASNLVFIINDHDRIKCLIHYTEPIHHSCKHKCQRDSNEKSVKGFQQSEFRMEKYGWQIAKQGCQHCYRRWKHVGGNNSRNAYHFPAKQNHGHGCNWRYLTGDVW